MLRRLLPTSIALAVGFLVLTLGLLRLQKVFRVEREEGRSGVTARRDALARYAEQALARTLEEALRRAEPEIDRALADPLVPAEHLLSFDRGGQRLPRRFTPRPGTSTPGADLFADLRRGAAARLRDAAEQDSPWQERLDLHVRFIAAVETGDDDEVARLFRAVLAHRVRYRVVRTHDLPYTLALLDFFAAESRPDASLLRALLHDGLDDGRGGRLRGLSRFLLESRDRFTAADLEALSAILVRLAEGSGAPYRDFLVRLEEEDGAALDVAFADVAAPSLDPVGGWCLVPAADGVRGLAVDFDALLDGVGREMASRGLLADGDRVATDGLASGRVEIRRLRLHVSSPLWAQALDDMEARYRLKTGLVVLTAVLALGIVTLALVLQHRRHQLVQLKADFVATVSHELRTPLASVRLLAETLERRLNGTAAAKDYPSRIVRETDALSFLVENILSFHRLEKGRWKIEPSDVSLPEIVAFLRSELELHFTRAVTLESEGLDGLTVRGDPELLKLLFLNLGRNACQYNRRDPVRITVRADGAGTVRFRDNGWGIPPEETRRVFTEFHRSRPEEVRGTGLGLAICRRIMKLHGGDVFVAETSPEGTTFELRFREVEVS